MEIAVVVSVVVRLFWVLETDMFSRFISCFIARVSFVGPFLKPMRVQELLIFFVKVSRCLNFYYWVCQRQTHRETVEQICPERLKIRYSSRIDILWRMSEASVWM